MKKELEMQQNLIEKSQNNINNAAKKLKKLDTERSVYKDVVLPQESRAARLRQ